MARQKSKKNKSYSVVKEGSVTKRFAPPGEPNTKTNLKDYIKNNNEKEEGK